MLGMFESNAKFVKQFDNFAGRIDAAAQAYARCVRSREFPGPAHVYAAASKP
jgi:3-methyl-2-oxobutanoate hydroxymethyltransferase